MDFDDKYYNPKDPLHRLLDKLMYLGCAAGYVFFVYTLHQAM